MTLLEGPSTPDCAHGPALVELAGFLADRGDAAGAYRLLRRAGWPRRLRRGRSVRRARRRRAAARRGRRLRPAPPAADGGAERPRARAGRAGSTRSAISAGSGTRSKTGPGGCTRRRGGSSAAGQPSGRGAGRARSPTPRHARHVRELRGSPWVADLALQRVACSPTSSPRGAGCCLTTRRCRRPVGARRSGRCSRSSVDRGRLELHDIGSGRAHHGRQHHAELTDTQGTVLLGRPLPVGDTYRAFSGFVEVPRARVDDFLRAIDDGDPRRDRRR